MIQRLRPVFLEPMRAMGARQEALPAFPAWAAGSHEPTLVSIIVVNHNYGRFLAAAIDSALAQEGVSTQVIVVDDGSTDGSREVLAEYRGRLEVVWQSNLGQEAAFNAGLARARGDLVFFLDADDLLEPHVAAAAARAVAVEPATARVVFRLAIVDEHGDLTGEHIPPRDVRLPHGDVRSAVLRSADDLAWPPTSGNAFAAWALHWTMPLPQTSRVGADAWLHPSIPLLGPVVALADIGGSYRAHGQNHAFRERLDIDRSRRIIRRTLAVHDWLRARVGELGYSRFAPRSVTLAAHRLISLRVGDGGHPVPGDTAWSAARAGIRAAIDRRDIGVRTRTLYVTWFVLAALAPRRCVQWLAEQFFFPSARRPWLRTLLTR